MWDLFISHASEDKEIVVRPLVSALESLGLKVWYDEHSLNLGDSLRRSIESGIKSSHFGIVILSKNFFKKEWTLRELDSLNALEVGGSKKILPIWYDVEYIDVLNFSPYLADKVGVSWAIGLDKILNRIVKAIAKPKFPSEFSAMSVMLALSYFTNFIEPLLQDIIERTPLLVDGYELTDLYLKIVCPIIINRYNETYFEIFQKSRSLTLTTFSVDKGRRRRSIWFAIDISDSPKGTIYDIPVLLKSVPDIVNTFMASNSNLLEKDVLIKIELENFKKALNHLIQHSAYAKYYVEIIDE